MELQQKHCVSLNVYDIQEQRKTEDIYQTLQTPPTVITRKASGKKITVPLLIINIVLLTTILLVVGIHFYHFRQTEEEKVLNAQKINQDYHFRQIEEEKVLNDQKMNQEIWYLYDGMFYLFWNNHSDCNTAYEFCQERRAEIATVTADNRDWLQSQINGKHLLVQRGDLDYHDMHAWMYMDLKPNCTTFGELSDLSEQSEGWVCAYDQRYFRN
ncbi:uncharacterized protein LOC132841009 [Tachysurus vachellii]|uniref:uncharacterized protein LOC132841009 n=1 Tax=Tachysurus vachellii TaxID=175792 RepID=UPI00296B3D2E|nr:uncharacterized protein LOC132841009 [Tachysurus vachellii]